MRGCPQSLARSSPAPFEPAAFGLRRGRSRGGIRRGASGAFGTLARIAQRYALVLCLLAAESLARSTLTVAAAASIRPALEEILQRFEQTSGRSVHVVYGSSGGLASQIRQGAPFDILLAADRTYADSVARWRRAAGPQQVFARGKLVLWTSIPGLRPDQGPAILRDLRIRRVAIADPALAPYGREAMRVLRAAGLEREIGPKLVRGDNVSQATQYAATGAVEAAFIATPQALSALGGKGRWAELDTAVARPIDQTAVLLRHGSEHHAAGSRQFLDFLQGKQARAILVRYGYLVP